MTLLKARGQRRTALDIGVSAHLAARLQNKLQRLEYRLADNFERLSVHTLPDGRILRR